MFNVIMTFIYSFINQWFLQAFVGPWPHFKFRNPIHSRKTPWRGDQPFARPLLTGQHKHIIKAHRHPCLEWDSNPGPQCSGERRQFNCDIIFSNLDTIVYRIFDSFIRTVNVLGNFLEQGYECLAALLFYLNSGPHRYKARFTVSDINVTVLLFRRRRSIEGLCSGIMIESRYLSVRRSGHKTTHSETKVSCSNVLVVPVNLLVQW
jgi:hypothetical protein